MFVIDSTRTELGVVATLLLHPGVCVGEYCIIQRYITQFGLVRL